MMRRYSRSHFFAFGVLPVLNAFALLVYGLEISTVGTYGEGETIPALVVMVGLCLLLTVVAAVKRGRDLGWTTFAAAAICVAAILIVPAGFALLLYLAGARGQADTNVHGATPGTIGVPSAVVAAALLAAPWVALRLLARFYDS